MNLQLLLDSFVEKFNRPDFIADDPISIPHRFSKKQDIEIAAFFAAMLAWGQRKTIINSTNKIMALMDEAPHDFIVNHKEKDRIRFEKFVHRTFQPVDMLCFLEFFQRYYNQNDSLETAFARHITPDDEHIEKALIGFHQDFFTMPYFLPRTRKHISTPLNKSSTCKRLCMYLRWMVRQDDKGVDFGIWQQISPAQLLIPLDVHVDRQARKLNLLHRKKADWLAVLELTKTLREFDTEDPVKYDFALFGMVVNERVLGGLA
jgi:uncharacterized protein (TIGR02757 family)